MFGENSSSSRTFPLLDIAISCGPEDHQPLAEKGGDYMSKETQPQPTSVVGLNNSSFPENPGSGATATDKLPTVASAASAAQAVLKPFSLGAALEVMDWEGGAQLPKPIGKGNGNKN